ncbi:CBS domain-containing protein [Rhizobium sp. RM]|uniref:CBS domain-containing protein n=1 Tax=Rhizobium sp. RM TaxID=2748079 RepID=UPI00110DC7EE|nr:CBS domain-containing protein [Rhizobium sp. RM]NWJ24034.1 CBS domain-containing protein [Rhizobium sp. RM]TMV21393.1 CBS domain-containing protein [Rhizobium sp. Td3]
MEAKDIMSTDIATISVDGSIRHAIDIMATKKISGLPVVTGEGEVVGMLTEGDLMRRAELGGGRGTDPSLPVDFQLYVQGNSWRVRDLMSDSLITVNEETPLARVAEIMATMGVKRLPVMNERRMVGIVSRSDVLKSMLHAPLDKIAPGDDAIAIAAAARLSADLGIPRQQVAVSVSSGIVTATGTVKSDVERRAIRVVVESLGGVEGYHDQLSLEGEAKSA